MNVYFYNNDKNKQELAVNAYNLCSRRKFVSILRGLNGVEIIRWPSIFNIYEFCLFEFEGCQFCLYEDDWDNGTFCFSSQQASAEVFNKIASYYKNHEIDIPVPRATSKFLVALLLVLLGVAILFALFTMGYISG
jgi:hypothetical protein